MQKITFLSTKMKKIWKKRKILRKYSKKLIFLKTALGKKLYKKKLSTDFENLKSMLN